MNQRSKIKDGDYMFVKNPKSIKRKCISVDEITRDYLIKHNYSPISYDNNKWLFIEDDEILDIVREFNK